VRHLVADLERIPGVVAGIATYVLAGELSVNQVLVGEWALNEKGIVERAGLGAAARAFSDADPAAAVAHVADLLAVECV
jgi:hypothetical protein